MAEIQGIFGVIISIFLAAFFFFMILPQMATALGQSSGIYTIIGVVIIVVLIFGLFVGLARR
jgi:hypothetical protein